MELNHFAPIRGDDKYGGFRAAIIARYESINIPLKIDITTGDIITPDAIHYAFQLNFENKSIEVWAYNVETIMAEKVETILHLQHTDKVLFDPYFDVAHVFFG